MALFAEHEAALPSWVGRTVINPRHIPLSRERVRCGFYAAIIECIKVVQSVIPKCSHHRIRRKRPGTGLIADLGLTVGSVCQHPERSAVAKIP